MKLKSSVNWAKPLTGDTVHYPRVWPEELDLASLPALLLKFY